MNIVENLLGTFKAIGKDIVTKDHFLLGMQHFGDAIKEIRQESERLSAKLNAMPAPEHDTGWRNIAGDLWGFREGSQTTFSFSDTVPFDPRKDLFLFRRAGDEVKVRIRFEAVPRGRAGGYSGSVAIKGKVPMCFVPPESLSIPVGNTGVWPAANQSSMRIDPSGDIVTADWGGLAGKNLVSFVISYYVTSPFPDVLPGTPWTPT